MKLGDFLSQAGSSTPAPTKPVKFKVLGINGEGQQVTAEAEAVIVFVDEHARQEAIREAHKDVRERWKNEDVPPDRLDDEITYQFLLKALRTADDPRRSFCASARELRNALTLRVCGSLMQQYRAFADEEFPDDVDNATLEELIKEAEKKSFADLISARGFSLIHRALPFLAARFGK